MENVSFPVLQNKETILRELVDFRRTGIFTQGITNLLDSKRQEFGLSIADAVVLLSITPQTYYNWWNGMTRRCNLMHRERIIRFISGQLDYLLRSQQSKQSTSEMKDTDWLFARVYKFRRQTQQLIKLFHISLTSPELSRQLLGKLETLCKNSLRQMNLCKPATKNIPRHAHNPSLPNPTL